MPLADPKYYRSQARELRELAAQLIQAERDELLRIAQHYERLAEKAEKRNAVRPPGSASGKV
jgi:uncharacterized protein (DUF305 family)